MTETMEYRTRPDGRVQRADDLALHLRTGVKVIISCRSEVANDRLEVSLSKMGGTLRRAPLGRSVRNLKIEKSSISGSGITTCVVTFDYLTHKNYDNDLNELISNTLKRLKIRTAEYSIVSHGTRKPQKDCPCNCWKECA